MDTLDDTERPSALSQRQTPTSGRLAPGVGPVGNPRQPLGSCVGRGPWLEEPSLPRCSHLQNGAWNCLHHRMTLRGRA